MASGLIVSYVGQEDEPLNYIDVFSRMQLEKLIWEYRPTMLFVENDRSFGEKIATKVIEL